MIEGLEMDLYAIDYLIIMVLALSGVIAIVRGFTREVLSILGWLAAFYGALFTLPVLRDTVRGFISPEWLADALILGTVFIVILTVFGIAAKRFTDSLKKSAIGTLDRLLGLAFGLARGVVILSFAYLILALLLPVHQHPDWVKNARLTPYLQSATGLVVKLVPIDNLSERVPDIDDLLKPPHIGDMIEQGLEMGWDSLPDNSPDNSTDKDDAAGYNQKTRDMLDALIRETAE